MSSPAEIGKRAKLFLSPNLIATWLLLIAFTFAADTAAVAQLVPPAAAGTISAVQGRVNVFRRSQSLVAIHGMPVQVADRLETARDGRATITLSDGTQLELGESSSLTLTENQLNPNGQRAATRLDLLRGFVRSVVRYAPGNAPNYEVHTPNAIAAARGTDYDTSYADNVERKRWKGCRFFTDVAVRDGEVESATPPILLPDQFGSKRTIARPFLADSCLCLRQWELLQHRQDWAQR